MLVIQLLLFQYFCDQIQILDIQQANHERSKVVDQGLRDQPRFEDTLIHALVRLRLYLELPYNFVAGFGWVTVSQKRNELVTM